MSTKKLSEIEALKVIDDSLDGLTPEEKQRIFSFVASKHSLASVGTGNNNFANKGTGGLHSTDGQTPVDVKQFLALKKPQGFYEQIACLGYFLEKVPVLPGFPTWQCYINEPTTRQVAQHLLGL